MFNFKKSFKDTVFYKNIFTLLKGSVLAQLIPLIISPFITRLYTPKELGVLAIFSSISVILGSVVNGRYEQALVLVKTEKEAVFIYKSYYESFPFSFFYFFYTSYT